jgi:hypothetical protein
VAVVTAAPVWSVAGWVVVVVVVVGAPGSSGLVVVVDVVLVVELGGTAPGATLAGWLVVVDVVSVVFWVATLPVWSGTTAVVEVL